MIDSFNIPEEIVIPEQSDGSVKEIIYLSFFSLLSCNPMLGVTIDQLFNKNKAKYAHKASNHQYYDLISHSGCFAEQIERGQKLLGMYLVEGDEVVLKLIQKGWPSFYKALDLIFIKNPETDKLLNAMEIYTDALNDFLKQKESTTV